MGQKDIYMVPQKWTDGHTDGQTDRHFDLKKALALWFEKQSMGISGQNEILSTHNNQFCNKKLVCIQFFLYIMSSDWPALW